MNSKMIAKAGLAAAVMIGLSAMPAAAKAEDSFGTMGTMAPTRVKVANSKAKYCFSQQEEGSIKTTCRTMRQWSDKGITILTD
jgi:hypothetical protein